MEDTLVQPIKEGLAHVIISNITGCSSYVSAGTVIREAADVEIIEEGKSASHNSVSTSVSTLEKQANESSVV